MEIRNSFETLSSLLGVSSSAASAAEGKNRAAAKDSALGADSATLSSAASEMSLAAGDEGVRGEKVAAIQGALADGTYSVPASDVAAKMVDAMLGGGR